MVSAWYTLVVGILISLDGIIFLIFPLAGFEFPNWYLGVMLLVGVIGIILGIASVTKKKSADKGIEGPSERVEEDTME